VNLLFSRNHTTGLIKVATNPCWWSEMGSFIGHFHFNADIRVLQLLFFDYFQALQFPVYERLQLQRNQQMKLKF
jgi:hypothetical protein